jgi:flavin reductase (DIM6/NTAB) family NADH-FMN oxidoreductase RutF
VTSVPRVDAGGGLEDGRSITSVDDVGAASRAHHHEGYQKADDTDHHEDDANRGNIHAIYVLGDGKLQDCSESDEDKTGADAHDCSYLADVVLTITLCPADAVMKHRPRPALMLPTGCAAIMRQQCSDNAVMGQVEADSGRAAFDALAGQLDYPMFVVTAQADGVRAGCLVGFATQVSIEPARFLVGLSKQNNTFAVASAASHLGVHVLAADDRPLARLFGEQTGDVTDKFAHCEWDLGPHELPILRSAVAWFTGRIVETVSLGDHVAFLLEPGGGRTPTTLGRVLTFADVREFEAGHDA